MGKSLPCEYGVNINNNQFLLYLYDFLILLFSKG